MKSYLGIGISVFLLSCGGKKHQPPISEPIPPKTPTVLNTNPANPTQQTSVVGFDKVKPIFQAKCFSCHNGTNHPKNWTIYETSKADLVKLNYRLFVVGNMPAVGSLTTEEKTIVKSWIDSNGQLTSTTVTPPTTEPTPTIPPVIEPTPVPPVVIPPVVPVVIPQASLDAGKKLVQYKCLECHGSEASGKSTPLLHGQQKDYLIKQLNYFKNDTRNDDDMNEIARSLTTQNITDITNYLSTQSPCSIKVIIESRGGDVSRGREKANSCYSCHTAIAPIIEGQKTRYLNNTLHKFRDVKRNSNYMNDVARPLTDTDINDLSAYFNSKRNCN